MDYLSWKPNAKEASFGTITGGKLDAEECEALRRLNGLGQEGVAEAHRGQGLLSKPKLAVRFVWTREEERGQYA